MELIWFVVFIFLFVGWIFLNIIFFWIENIQKTKLEEFYCQVYTCLQRACGKEFANELEMREHLSDQHQVSAATLNDLKCSFKCLYKRNESNVCGKKLESLNKIANHICKIHLANESREMLIKLNLFFKQIFDYQSLHIVNLLPYICFFFKYLLYIYINFSLLKVRSRRLFVVVSVG